MFIATARSTFWKRKLCNAGMTFSSIVFVSSLQEDYFLYVDYRAIGVHAICHSPEIYKQHCIYCQVSDPHDTVKATIDFSPSMSVSEYLMEEEPLSVEEIFFSPNNSEQCTV